MLLHSDAKRSCPYWSSYRNLALLDPAMLAAAGAGANSVTLFASLCWEADGEQTFLLGADQCRMFREMDLSGITPNDIKYPFESFYICMEGSGLKLRASMPTDLERAGLESGFDPEHSVQGVYVTRRSSLEGGTQVRDGFVHESIGMSADGRLMGDTLTIVVWAHNKSANPSDDIMFGYSLEDAKILQSMDFESAILSILNGEKRNDQHCTSEEEEFNRVTALEVSRIVVGMCAYLECRQAVVVERDFSDEIVGPEGLPAVEGITGGEDATVGAANRTQDIKGAIEAREGVEISFAGNLHCGLDGLTGGEGCEIKDGSEGLLLGDEVGETLVATWQGELKLEA